MRSWLAPSPLVTCSAASMARSRCLPTEAEPRRPASTRFFVAKRLRAAEEEGQQVLGAFVSGLVKFCPQDSCIVLHPLSGVKSLAKGRT